MDTRIVTIIVSYMGVVNLRSTIKCPECGHEKEETMAEDACTFFYTCTNCGVVLRPKTGDCCVFCSFGDVKCPPEQTTAD